MPITGSQLLALPSPKPPALTIGIKGWVQEVASSSTRSCKRLVAISANIPKSQQRTPHQPTTSEQRGTKRKSTIDNGQNYIPEKEDEAVTNPQMQKRPRRPPKVAKNPAQTIPILYPTPQVDAQTAAFGSTSPKSSRRSSPRKGAKYIDQPISTLNVDMKTLETCSPGVTQMTDIEAKQHCQVPA